MHDVPLKRREPLNQRHISEVFSNYYKSSLVLNCSQVHEPCVDSNDNVCGPSIAFGSPLLSSPNAIGLLCSDRGHQQDLQRAEKRVQSIRGNSLQITVQMAAQIGTEVKCVGQGTCKPASPAIWRPEQHNKHCSWIVVLHKFLFWFGFKYGGSKKA
jgi:hypothetical protein